jgi:hypothetical protein
MPDLREDLLQFIWQHRLLRPSPLVTASGKTLSVIRPGDLNKDSGPDFFNARIIVNGLTLAGNIELHVNSSDWIKHGHESDPNYDNIILHVVYHHDAQVKQNETHNVEVLELKELIPENVIRNYEELMRSKQDLACGSQFANADDQKFSMWLQRMFTERLEYKTNYIEELFLACGGDYVQTFYNVLLRSFGFKVNALPFELLSKQVPASILLRHSDNLLQLEALLFGASGFLEETFSDKYIQQLQNEFEFLKRKYGIIPLKKEVFKFSRLRPANFPTLRLAQLAALVHSYPQLFSAPHQFTSFDEIQKCLKISSGDYWKKHYRMDGYEAAGELKMGEESVSNIIINAFTQFLFFYFRKNPRQDHVEIAFSLAEKCSFEKNSKTKIFSSKVHLFKSAADSQALINLHDNYCSRKNCLKCPVAADILG